MTLHKPKIVPFSHLFLIQAVTGASDFHASFLDTAQQAVDSIIPESLWLQLKSNTHSESIFDELQAMLPLFKCSELDATSDLLSITYLCPAEYTHNAHRCVLDTISRSLIPGQQAEISGGLNLHFAFAHSPNRRLIIGQELISIRSPEEASAIQRHLPQLIDQLKDKLPSEELRRSDSAVHSIFMPRNEEEVIRNLIVLSDQIKYVRDLPQISIHYERQTDVSLTFTVLIVRLLKKQARSLREMLASSSLKIDIDDIRLLGPFKQRYPKESAICRITVDKRPFFRADHSLDLLRARQHIVAGLESCLGEFRDFNGGMILKQDEAFTQLRQELGPLCKTKEFLLENYFYSLKPSIMQTVHEPWLLKKHFEQLRSLLQSTGPLQFNQILSADEGKFVLYSVGATRRGFKEGVLRAVSSLEIPTCGLTTSVLEGQNGAALGFIFRAESAQKAQIFQNTVQEAFSDWIRYSCCHLHAE